MNWSPKYDMKWIIGSSGIWSGTGIYACRKPKMQQLSHTYMLMHACSHNLLQFISISRMVLSSMEILYCWPPEKSWKLGEFKSHWQVWGKWEERSGDEGTWILIPLKCPDNGDKAFLIYLCTRLGWHHLRSVYWRAGKDLLSGAAI